MVKGNGYVWAESSAVCTDLDQMVIWIEHINGRSETSSAVFVARATVIADVVK